MFTALQNNNQWTTEVEQKKERRMLKLLFCKAFDIYIHSHVLIDSFLILLTNFSKTRLKTKKVDLT